MDYVSVMLCLCIGSVMAWLMAIYSERGAHRLLANTVLGAVGALMGGWALALISADFRTAALLITGPAGALVAIWAGQAAWLRLRSGRAGI